MTMRKRWQALRAEPDRSGVAVWAILVLGVVALLLWWIVA